MTKDEKRQMGGGPSFKGERHGSCKVGEHSILSLSKDVAQATSLRKPASFDRLRMLVSGLSSDFARALEGEVL
jgi:hypothetical protein